MTEPAQPLPRLSSLNRLPSVAQAAQDAKLRAYKDGMSDGIKMMLDQIGRDPAALAPEGQYEGPIPDELRAWMAGVRSRLHV